MVDLHGNFTIGSIVEAMLPRFGSAQVRGHFWRSDEPAKALYICLDLNFSAYEEGEDLGDRKFVHFLFCRPHNYTAVFAAVTGNPYRVKMEDFQRWSFHDSCWRTDGLHMLGKTAQDMRNSIRERTDAAISEFNTIEFIEWRMIQWEDRKLVHFEKMPKENA